MIGRVKFCLQSWLCRWRLARDPAWRRIHQDERKARKAHRKYSHMQAAKRERMHALLAASAHPHHDPASASEQRSECTYADVVNASTSRITLLNILGA